MLHHFFRKKRIPGFNILIGLCLSSGMLVSCEKSEGFGGTASISGTVTEEFYNDDYSLLIHEKPAVDEEVFIVFGDDKALGSRVRTNQNGQFMFKYLFPGQYEVYIISGDPASGLNLDMEKAWKVELERGQDLEMGDLVKQTALNWDDGSAKIKGRVKVIDYVDTSTWPNLVIEKTYYGTEQEVYLTYGDHTFYDERIRSQFDGTFEFGRLIPGSYMVFLYSDDVSGESDKLAHKFEVNITSLEEVVDLGEIVIEKL